MAGLEVGETGGTDEIKPFKIHVSVFRTRQILPDREGRSFARSFATGSLTTSFTGIEQVRRSHQAEA